MSGNKLSLREKTNSSKNVYSKQKKKKRKEEIIRNNEFKYGIEPAEDVSDTYSDIYLQTDDDFNLLDDKITMEEKEKYYFGSKAKTRFWQLYKSDRIFKDNKKDDIKDPRFAYLKDCYDNNMLPKIGLVIRGEKTTHLSFANQSLLQKNTKAVCQSLRRYPLDIQSLDFSGNGIKAPEWTLIWDSIDSHLGTLLHLNFANNKIGAEGASSVWEKIKEMKNLESLNLQGNLLGDDSCGEIMKIINGLLNIKSLNFSDNALGNKVVDSLFVEQIWIFLKSTNTLQDFDLSWNNFRGAGAETLLSWFKENYSIKTLNLSYNLFGVSGGDAAPSIAKFVEVLQENHILEEVDLSNNLLDSNAAFYLAQGLKTNTTLKSFQISGNPIGSSGVKYLFQSLNENKEGKIQNLELKETETIIQDKKIVFDPSNFEKEYSLDLSQINDRAILYHLLDIDEKMITNVSEEDTRQQGDCFQDAKLGSSSWSPPKDKDSDGKWNLGDDPKDTLIFKFSLNPSPKSKENPTEEPTGTSVSPSHLQKPLIPPEVLDKNIDFIARLNLEENTSWIRELIDTICQEYTLTYLQAKTLITSLEDNYKIYAITCTYNRIINRHFRQDIFQCLPNIDTKISLMHHLGQSYHFRYYNPTGHYKLKLNNRGEREVALTLLMLNRKYCELVKQGIISDRSKMGNGACFRNEKLVYEGSRGYGAALVGGKAGGEGKNMEIPFIYSDDFVLPEYGTLEWDFIYLGNPPLKEEQTSEEKQDLIKNILLGIEGEVDKQIAAFKALSEYLVLSSEQLSSFIELIDDPKWKTECYMAGVWRIYDTREYDFIKKKWKYPETSKEIYNRFGILNLFNPFKCTGSYRLDLGIYEERWVWKILFELAKVEGYEHMASVSLDGVPQEEINKEFADKLPETGIFEGSYVTPEEAADNELREKIGRKYLGWTPEDV